jgi:hypothetical protein
MNNRKQEVQNRKAKEKKQKKSKEKLSNSSSLDVSEDIPEEEGKVAVSRP